MKKKKIKHKKRIHYPSLTMKHKEKRLEYQTINVKEWGKFVLSDKKEFNLDSPDGFRKYWLAKNFLEENYSTRHSGGGSFMI